MTRYPRCLAAGDRALLVEFGDRIDDRLNQQVLALAAALAEVDGLVEIIPTYRSVTLQYDPQLTDFDRLCQQIARILATPAAEANLGRRWRVPVCYGGAWGEDLAALAEHHQLTPQQAIDLHSAADYRVYMIGFMPGFAYLGGLSPSLFTPRRASPRAMTPGSSINIGGQQTAISSVPGPSGWHLIGRTPWVPFDPRRARPFLFRAGDRVRFEPISEQEFQRLAPRYRDGLSPQPENEL